MTVHHSSTPIAVLITGASSGIGAALALTYSGPSVRLTLGGRDRARLEEVAAACREKGAVVEAVSLDVTAREEMRAWIEAADHARPLDLVIANAGISGGTADGGESEAQVRQIFEINVTGMLNTVHPAIDAMRKRSRGQIAVLGSAASFRGIPSAPAYSATKAAVRAYGEALRGVLYRDGIAVSVICPGFVKSRITDANRFRMPLLMEADRAARIIRRGLARNKARIAFPWPTYLVAWLTGSLPPGLTDAIYRGLPEK